MGVDVAQKVDLKPIPFAPMNFLEPAQPTGQFSCHKRDLNAFWCAFFCILLFSSLLTFSKFVFPTHFLTLLALGTLSGSSRGIPQTWWYLSARTCIIICSPTLVECPRSQRATTFWSPQLFKQIRGWFGDSTSCFLRHVDSRTERLVVSLGFRDAPDWLIQVAKAQLVVFNDQNTNWWLNWFKACPVAKFVGIVPEMKTTQMAKSPESNMCLSSMWVKN